MKSWYGHVVVSYWQQIFVDAETEDQARQLMMERFDINKAGQGEGDIYDFEELKPSDDTYDEYGVNTKNSFNTPPRGEI